MSKHIFLKDITPNPFCDPSLPPDLLGFISDFYFGTKTNKSGSVPGVSFSNKTTTLVLKDISEATFNYLRAKRNRAISSTIDSVPKGEDISLGEHRIESGIVSKVIMTEHKKQADQVLIACEVVFVSLKTQVV